MSGQITRLENYVTSMNALQKLDDIVIHPQNTETEPMLQEFREITSFLCDQYHLSYTVEGSLPSQLWVDGEIILQVFENLVSNAARYAKERITVLCTCKDTHFVIDVMDDGTGFSEKDLLFATRPYYGSDKNGQEGHFGLGLNICKNFMRKTRRLYYSGQ